MAHASRHVEAREAHDPGGREAALLDGVVDEDAPHGAAPGEVVSEARLPGAAAAALRNRIKPSATTPAEEEEPTPLAEQAKADAARTS